MNDRRDLEGLSALVTGATSGIGQAAADLSDPPQPDDLVAQAARSSGSIINIASMAGQIGLNGAAAYGATKASLASMTRSWAAEFSPAGVRVNAIAAGPVLTGATTQRIEALGAATLLARAAQPGAAAHFRTPVQPTARRGPARCWPGPPDRSRCAGG